MKLLKNLKKANNGITLIALVITIIVLLILAGVSIAMLTGENGILTQANNANKQTEIAQAKERAKLDILEWRTNQIRNKDDATLDKAKIETILKESMESKSGKEYIKAVGTDSFTTKSGYEILYSELDSSIQAGGTGVVAGEIVAATAKDNYTDSETNKATVPAGFTVSKIPSEQTISTGLVIYDIPEDEIETVDWETKNEDGAYQVQTLYNQFVWIPVKTEDEYKRDFSYPSNYDKDIDTTPANSTFTDTGYLPTEINSGEDTAGANETAERTAVIKYNGFYIARYEAGDENAKTARGSAVDGTLVSKQDKFVYNYIKQVDSKSKAQTLLTTNNNVKVALCSGIQWDMVMKFVDGKTPAKGTNTFNVRVVDSNRHTGSVAKTGKNDYDKVQNIYDLEGNCREWVAEKNNTSFPFVYRGGSYTSYSDDRACERISNYDNAYYVNSFRPVLYVM